MTWSLVLVFLTGLVSVEAAAEPSFTGLGDLPGGSYESNAWGVSGDGSVVVGHSVTTSGNEAFVWTLGGGMVGIGDPLVFPIRTEANAVSDDGLVVVGLGESAAGHEGFRWTAGGGMVPLGDLPGGTFGSTALAVSADGSVIVGQGQSDASSGGTNSEGFLWTSGGGMVALGDLPGGQYNSTAKDLSADGSVIVGGSSSVNTSFAFEAYWWTSAGGMVALGDLPGGAFASDARDVSSDGSVIVGRGTPGVLEAFRWTSSNGMVGLGFLPIANSSFAEGVSGDGLVVVGASSGFGAAHAFIWDPAEGMRRLQEVLVDDLGLDLTGWTLERATAISTDGLSIVGYGENPSGDREAWRAVLAPFDTFEAVGSGIQAVELLGGPAAAGGVDITVDSATGGVVTATYDTPTATEINEAFDLDTVPNFQVPGTSSSQFWDIGFVDGELQGSVEIVFTYDPALLGGFPEQSIIVLHLLEGGGAELFQPGNPNYAIDTLANTITLTVTSVSPFVLGIPEESTWQFFGEASGGTIDFLVADVSLQVMTIAGQTATQVATAIADAINADPTLAAAGLTATVDANAVMAIGSITSVVLTDAGLTHHLTVGPYSVPAFSSEAFILLTAALIIAATLRLRSRVA